MTGYTKLFGSIIASTIWREDNDTRILWITMLACADYRGVVEASVPGLADYARLPVEATKASLAKLLAPDPESRTKDFEGRRIREVDGGWLVINHAKYREKMSAEDRREYQRAYMAQYRAAGKDKTRSGKYVVNTGKQMLGRLGQSEADSDTNNRVAASPLGSEHQAFIKGWCKNFRVFHGFDYAFDGGRDGKAVKKLLGMNILRIDLLEIAKQAWARNKADGQWNCKQAETINGFQNQFNQIRAELNNGNGTDRTNHAQNPRCVGQHLSVTDYGAVAKRREAEAMARQVARDSGQPPAA